MIRKKEEVSEDDGEEPDVLAVEGLHAVRSSRVEIDAVALIERYVLAVDLQEKATFENEVELLRVVRIEVHGFGVGFRFDGHEKRFTVRVLEIA